MNDIEQLKRYIVQSEELSEPLNYFFNLTAAEVFSKIKSYQTIENVKQHTELMAVIEILQNEMETRLDKSIKLVPTFHEIPEYHFFHGVCLSVYLFMPLTVIYFSDVKTGIFAITGSQTDIFRFSTQTSFDMKEKILMRKNGNHK